MSDDFSSDEVRNAWQNQHLPPFRMSVNEIRARFERSDKQMRRQGSITRAVCLALIAIFIAFLFVFTNAIQRIGSLLTAWAAGYFLYQVHLYQVDRKRAANSTKRNSSTSAEFYRAELQRRCDFHRGIWLWSRVMILLPGPLLFLIGLALSHPEVAFFVYAEMAVFLILLALAVPLNQRLSRRYRREIDELTDLQKDG